MTPANDSGKPQNFSASLGANNKSDVAVKGGLLVPHIIKAIKDLTLYPAGNMNVTESINKALLVLKENFSPAKPVEIIAERERLLVDGAVVGVKDPRVNELCLSLYKRGIYKIILDPNISADEMKTFLGTITAKPGEIAEAGGIANLIKTKRIVHASVEGAADLLIVDGDSLEIPAGVLSEIAGIEMGLTQEELGRPEVFDQMFARVECGDPASLNLMRVLLRNTSLFSAFLEKLALQIERAEEDASPARRVGYLLMILRAMGKAIKSLPSDDERGDLLRNLALSVLGLSTNIRDELVMKGLMPNIALTSVESDILSRFPVSDLAEALAEHFEVSGAAASMLQSSFRNLSLPPNEKAALAQVVRRKLEKSEMLTPEVDLVLHEEESGTADLKTAPETADSRRPLHPIEGYDPGKVLFDKGERNRFMNAISAELAAPLTDEMAPVLLELLRHEAVPANHGVLVARAKTLMENVLKERRYEAAAIFLAGLQAELDQKKDNFSLLQLKSLRMLVEDYLGEPKMRTLIETLKDLNRESPEFQNLCRYFDAAGNSAVKALANTLNDEESRHARLLICQALAALGDKSIATVAERIRHPKWYVVRNAVAILALIGKPQCVQHLRNALSHSDIRVRREALKGLATIRTDEAIELVCGHLNTADMEMCKAAIGWAAVMESEQALPALDRLLGSENIWKEDEEVVKLAIGALGSIGSEAAMRTLRKLSGTHSLFRFRKASLIRAAAAAALRGIEEEIGR